MCDVGGGDGCDVFNERDQKARKWHWCCCGALIAPGEVYRRIFTLYDGNAHDYRMCGLCMEAMKVFEEAHDGYRFADAFEAVMNCARDRDYPPLEDPWQYWIYLMALNERRSHWAYGAQLAAAWAPERVHGGGA